MVPRENRPPGVPQYRPTRKAVQQRRKPGSQAHSLFVLPNPLYLSITASRARLLTYDPTRAQSTGSLPNCPFSLAWVASGVQMLLGLFPAGEWRTASKPPRTELQAQAAFPKAPRLGSAQTIVKDGLTHHDRSRKEPASRDRTDLGRKSAVPCGWASQPCRAGVSPTAREKTGRDLTRIVSAHQKESVSTALLHHFCDWLHRFKVHELSTIFNAP